MAVKARAEITLSSIRDVQSVTRYYLLQSSTSAVPSKPTTNPPGGDWVTAEPTYTSGSTNSLYFTDLTVFSDGTFVYSDVSLSSSYEAAKVAYNKAENAEDIAERATHSINLTPYGSRSFDDTHYWYNGHEHGGTIGSTGVIWNTEQLADGWIHICVDATGYTGTAKYVSDNAVVRTSPSFKLNTLYTILYEIRNNNSVLAETSANNTQFYIQEAASKVFWGGSVTEVLEGGGTGSGVILRTMVPEGDITYRKRVTKMSDSGTHAGSNPPHLFQMQHRYGAGDYVDFELRISIYEGRYLGDYMPYVISDTTDIEADISAANALAQSAKNTADGKITTFYAASTATPTATTVGDLWIKTDDGNSLWRWDGTAWVSVDNADIQSALTAAGTAQATADSKIVTFAQTSSPTATDVGDIWIDTDDDNRMYRWDGEDWVDVHDPKIAENSDRLDESDARIKELVSDGANLIIGTTYPDASSDETLPRIFGQTHATRYNNAVASVAEHGFRVTNKGTGYTYITFGNTEASGFPPGMNGLVAGETYTLSADVTCMLLSNLSNTKTYYLQIHYYDDHANPGTLASSKTEDVVPIQPKTDHGVEKTGRCEFTFTIPDNVTQCYIGFWCNNSVDARYKAGDFIELRNIKLEKGSKATPWSSPVDWNAKIVSSANGKNTNTYTTKSSAGVITYPANAVAGDQLFVAEYGSTVYTTLYRFNGTSWENTQIGGMAVTQLDAGNVVSGTMSANRIKGDTLTLGGANDVDGMLKVYDANGTLVGSFTREGLMAIAGTIGGWTINSSELTGEWQETYQHFESLLSPVLGLQFEETSTEPGFDAQFLNSIWYGTAGISFLQRRTINNAVQQVAAFISADTNGGWDGSGREGQITISPHLRVDGTGIDTPHMRADASYAWNLASGSYIRQPAMIMSGSTTISTGTSSKRATICTIPVEYQTGWRIIPFVTRTYGNSEATPADAGDFYYAYYNSADHKVCVKLANVLASGTAYTFDYMIYAVPTT